MYWLMDVQLAGEQAVQRVDEFRVSFHGNAPFVWRMVGRPHAAPTFEGDCTVTTPLLRVWLKGRIRIVAWTTCSAGSNRFQGASF